ncbi:MAG: pyridoxal phosphate-dependent aminotransferase [Peptococcaceae bacterium]|jgi:alanine-synthesizing transaminase|nr:pyridoxal phosphate-dependent aminotransferase [Peptococcaceae bacterium]
MINIPKSKKLDNVHYDIRGPLLEEANQMRERGIDILHLNIGNPAPFGVLAPDEIIYDMKLNIKDAQGYCDSKGLFAARKAVMQYCQLKKIPNVGIEDIYIGNGVSEMITISMQALLNDGDEILLPTPGYPLWTASVTLSGGKAVHYICDEQAEWNPDLEDIRGKITDRTKGIVVINPNNPTGALYDKDILLGIVEIARRHQLILFVDEIYDRLVMDNLEHIALGSLAPDLFVVNLNGLSKSHRICGFRSGWLALSGDKSGAGPFIDGLNVLTSMRLCANVPAQYVIQTALGGYQSAGELLAPGGRIYEQREFVCQALAEIPGISFVKPKAAFYIFPKIDLKKYPIKDDTLFALDFLRQERVLIVQGSGFAWPAPDHFRLVYLARNEDLGRGISGLARFLRGYRQ